MPAWGEVDLSGDVEKQVILLRLTASLEVEIVDDLGAPVEGVQVRIASGVACQGTTGPNGLFISDPLLAGSVNVRLRAGAESGVAVDDRSQNRDVAVGEYRRGRLRYELLRHGSASLRVTSPGTSGNAEALRKCATVTLTPEDPSSGAKSVRKTIAVDEVFEAEALAPGRYAVRVSFSSSCGLSLPGGLDPIEIRPGEVTSVVIETVRFSQNITGTIRLRDGTPAALLPLSVLAIGEDDRPIPFRGNVARTDAEGSFTIKGVAEGTCRPHTLRSWSNPERRSSGRWAWTRAPQVQAIRRMRALPLPWRSITIGSRWRTRFR